MQQWSISRKSHHMLKSYMTRIFSDLISRCAPIDVYIIESIASKNSDLLKLTVKHVSSKWKC